MKTDQSEMVLEEKPEMALNLKNAMQCPGLTSGAVEVPGLAEDIIKRLAVLSYKERQHSFWVVFVGGTGTGKSTLFNAFCGKALSDSGVERPKTKGPVVYAHEEVFAEDGFPFSFTQIDRRPTESTTSVPAQGSPESLLILEHLRKEWSHLLIVDTPDVDSVEANNRHVAEDFYLLADTVVFVTSQEKYADEVPFQLLMKTVEEEKPCFLLLNKGHQYLTVDELHGFLQAQGIPIGKERLWLIPHCPSDPLPSIMNDSAFRDFANELLSAVPEEELEDLRTSQLNKHARIIQARVERLLHIWNEEHGKAQQWLEQLEAVYRKTSLDLIAKEKQRFSAESKEFLQWEVKRLLKKYDVLAGPRRIIRDIILTPFRLLGLRKEVTQKAQKDALLKVREKIDLTPVASATERFNRLVLEGLSPSDDRAPLFKALRRPGVMMEDEEIRKLLWQEHDRLDTWLKETFQALSKGLPKHKKWGIYSTSILWGVLILCFEVVVGGGFTVLDAMLDSVLAPFVTKGAVELFAYGEIKKIARDLANRYQDGLLSVVKHQRHRYETCLRSLMPPRQTMEELESLHRKISHSFPDGPTDAFALVKEANPAKLT